jgi:ABC-type multidrug transport system ATPase subunit
MTNRAAADVNGVREASGTTMARAGADLHADAARVLGLLGPDVAGKTALAQSLTTLPEPDAGQARAAGFDLVRDAAPAGPVTGLTGQAAAGELPGGRENLELAGGYIHLPKAGRAARAGSRQWPVTTGSYPLRRSW